MLKKVISRDNPVYKQAQKIKHLQVKGMALVEGERFLNEAVRNHFAVKTIFIRDENWPEEHHSLIQLVADVNPEIHLVLLAPSLFNDLSTNSTPPAVISIIQQPVTHVEPPNRGRILFLDHIQNPGNLGTIIRTALALGFDQIILSNCVNRLNTKVIQASAGSSLQAAVLPTSDPIGALHHLKHAGFSLFTTTVQQGRDFRAISWSDFPNLVLIVGNEGSGVGKEISTLADHKIKIPMAHNIESLNVGVATGILCYFITLAK